MLRFGIAGRRSSVAAPSRALRPRTGYAAVIVGGGLHGLCVARALAERHGVTDVAVLDAGGVLREMAPPLLRLQDTAAVFLDIFRAALPRWRRIAAPRRARRRARGHVLLAHGEAAAAAHRFQAYLSAGAGLRYTGLDIDDLRRLCPGLALFEGTHLAVLEGSYLRDAAIPPATEIMHRMAGDAVRRGCHLLSGVAPVRLRTVGGRISGIETSHGIIHAERILLNAPATSQSLANGIGLALPLQLEWTDRVTTMPLAPWLSPSVASEALGIELWQAEDGAVTIMGSDAVTRAVALFPALASATVATHLRVPCERTADAMPILGPAGPDGLLVNAGWAGGAVWSAPVVGDMLADAMVGDVQHLPAEFSPRRFGAHMAAA